MILIFTLFTKFSFTTMDVQLNGKAALAKVLSIPKNIEILHKYITETAVTNNLTYNALLFEVIDDIRNKIKIADILIKLKTNKYLWMSDKYTDMRNKQQEQDDFLVNPFEVEEGVLECPRCKKNKTISFQKQTRSADEPMTTFAECINCRHKWTYSG